MSRAPLGIVIPTVGRFRLLARALTRLERQRCGPGSFEVVVAHSPASDGQRIEAAIGERPYPVRMVRSDRGDASSQRNAGWRALTTPLVLFLDDDVLATRGLVEAHLRAHERRPEPEAGVVGHVRWVRWPPPTAFMRWLEHGIQFDYKRVQPDAEVGWWHFYTANASVKRTMLERVHGFDAERFPFGYEDLDVAKRMAGYGFRLHYVPEALAEHDHRQTLADWRTRVWRIAAAERAFCARHPETKAHFHDLFSDAAAQPPARGWGARLAPFIPQRTPWLGARAWGSFNLRQRQALAGEFLRAWEASASPHAEP